MPNRLVAGRVPQVPDGENSRPGLDARGLSVEGALDPSRALPTETRAQKSATRTPARAQSDHRNTLQIETAYRVLKQAVIGCTLMPGEALTAAQFEDRFSLGRAAVRSALTRLYQERLILAIPRQGYVIAPITITDLDEMFAVRLLLEPPATELAAHHPDRLTASSGWLDLSRPITFHPNNQRGMEAVMRQHTAFHTHVALCSGNSRLARTLEALLQDMERIFNLGYKYGGPDSDGDIVHEHDDLIAALLSGNGKQAAEIARLDIINSKRMALLAMMKTPALRSVNLGVS